jgi:hypothetical protein
MSSDVKGSINYALVKRHYDADDYTSLRIGGVTYLNGIPFTANQTYYVVGLFAYLADNNVVDPNKGWTLYTHGQPAAPAYMLPFLAALGITTWPASLPSFEAKDILFYATEDCWVSFVDSPRVQHFIPAETYVRFHRRCFIFFVIRDTADGNLRAYIEG